VLVARELCPGPVGRIVDGAPPRPRPVARKPSTRPAPRPPRFYEKPWLWAGLLVVTSAAVILAATLTPHDTSYRADVNGASFTR
jgi:hypothetical protein